MTDAETPSGDPSDPDDPDPPGFDGRDSRPNAGGSGADDGGRVPDSDAVASGDRDLEALREEIERRYDFDDFGPADMAEMSASEWEAAFDPGTWITGTELLDRVEAELKNRIADREVFAVLERVGEGAPDGGPDRVVAYSDEGYAVVYPDGSVEGEGTVLRDVEPTVALCSMDSFEVADPPAEYGLPDPGDVESGTGDLGNNLLQVVAAVQLLAGVVLVGGWLSSVLAGDALSLGLTTIVAPVVGVGFVLAGLLFLLIVANARLSDRFRAEEFRDRLRAVQFEDGERPDFVPLPESGEGAGPDRAEDDHDRGTGAG